MSQFSLLFYRIQGKAQVSFMSSTCWNNRTLKSAVTLLSLPLFSSLNFLQMNFLLHSSGGRKWLPTNLFFSQNVCHSREQLLRSQPCTCQVSVHQWVYPQFRKRVISRRTGQSASKAAFHTTNVFSL